MVCFCQGWFSSGQNLFCPRKWITPDKTPLSLSQETNLLSGGPYSEKLWQFQVVVDCCFQMGLNNLNKQAFAVIILPSI